MRYLSKLVAFLACSLISVPATFAAGVVWETDIGGGWGYSLTQGVLAEGADGSFVAAGAKPFLNSVNLPCLTKVDRSGVVQWNHFYVLGGLAPYGQGVIQDIVPQPGGGYEVAGVLANYPISSPVTYFSALINESGEMSNYTSLYTWVPSAPFGELTSWKLLADGGRLQVYRDARPQYSQVVGADVAFYLERLAPNGDTLFLKTFHVNGYFASKLSMRDDGGFWLILQLVDGDPSGVHSYNYRVLLLDENGNVLSDSVVPGTPLRHWTEVDATPDGGFLLADTGPNRMVVPGEYIVTDLIVTKFSPDGAMQYQSVFEDSEGYGGHGVGYGALDAAPTPDGGFLLAMYKHGTYTMQVVGADNSGEVVWSVETPSAISRLPVQILPTGDNDAVLISFGLRSMIRYVSPDWVAPPVVEPPPAEKKPIVVEMDVLPGNEGNTLNPEKNGVVAVGFLTTAEFDALTIDPEEAFLEDMGVVYSGKKPYTKITDLDKDGDDDLVLHFAGDGLSLAPGAQALTFTGKTFDGEDLQGTATVRLVGKK